MSFFKALSGLFSGDDKQDKQQASIPEVLGLRLGGAIELDSLMLKLNEEFYTFTGVATTQFIQAVGVVELGENTRLVRYYTDDEGYIQILQEGKSDAGVIEVSLWYFFDTKVVDYEPAWNELLQQELINTSAQLDGETFNKYWQDTRPVFMKETTYRQSSDSNTTDQFAMLYSRHLANGQHEELLLVAEERLVNNNFERSFVRSTGIQLKQTDFKAVA